jgi:Beta-galactosidase
MSRHEGIRVSDYSPRATLVFQGWMRDRYKSIEALNQALGTRHLDFNTVMPPSKDIRAQKNASISEHFDSYAHGVVPIEGWLEKLPAGHSIRIYVDGQSVGTAEYGLSRQDAYEVVESIKRAQVGFRYLLDFSKLSRGGHHIQVVVDGPQGYLLAERDILVMTGSKRPGATTTPRAPRPPSAPKDVRFHLERPDNQLTLFYNPGLQHLV